ncbi:DoxX family protein, partial [Faecalibacter rhinopitheci]
MRSNFKHITITIISYLFILLFVYAAISKIMDFETFQVQLGQSPILSAYAGVIAYGVIATELIIAGLFIFKRTRLVAYYGGYMLMVAFTVYIYLILNFSDYIPCSCGGILEKMGWTEHLVFNVVFVVFAVVGILFLSPFSKKNATSIIVAGIIAIGSMITLFFNSEYIIKQENNFTRRYLPHPIIEQEAINLGANSYYFAGFDAHKIYLGNYTAPLILTSINLDLKDVEKHRIELEQSNFNFRAITIKVFEDEFYVYDGNVPVIFKGCLPNYRAE